MKTLLLGDKRKLKEDHKTITISVTQLQNFISPSMYTIDDKEIMEEVFSYGDYVEQIWNATIQGNSDEDARERGYLVADHISDIVNGGDWKRDIKKKEFLWLGQNTRKIVDLCIDNNLHVPEWEMFNFRQKIAIEASSYKVILSGEYDGGIPHIRQADCKTAGSAWSDEKIATRKQNIYYPLMDMFHNNAELTDTMEFDFHIFRKLKTPKLQIVSSTVTYGDALDQLESDLYIYLKSL